MLHISFRKWFDVQSFYLYHSILKVRLLCLRVILLMFHWHRHLKLPPCQCFEVYQQLSYQIYITCSRKLYSFISSDITPSDNMWYHWYKKAKFRTEQNHENGTVYFSCINFSVNGWVTRNDGLMGWRLGPIHIDWCAQEGLNGRMSVGENRYGIL